jgi:hypothetical protein
MSMWGCGSPATYCQPAAAAGFIYCRSQEWTLHSPSPAGFVYLEFSWTCALLFSPVYIPTCNCSHFFLFRVCVGMCLSPTLLWSMPHFSHCYKPSPLQAHWGRWCHSHLFWPACLFQFIRGSIPPHTHSPELRALHLLCYVSSFFQLLVYYSVCLFFFSFFPGWGSVCPGGYADLFQGCLWEYHVLLSSPGGLLLPCRIEAGIWRHGSPPGFSI